MTTKNSTGVPNIEIVFYAGDNHFADAPYIPKYLAVSIYVYSKKKEGTFVRRRKLGSVFFW